MSVTVIKRSVSIDAETARVIEEMAEEEGISFSAWLTRSAERDVKIRRGLQAVAEWEAEHGALTQEEIDEADAILDRLWGKSAQDYERR